MAVVMLMDVEVWSKTIKYDTKKGKFARGSFTALYNTNHIMIKSNLKIYDIYVR